MKFINTGSSFDVSDLTFISKVDNESKLQLIFKSGREIILNYTSIEERDTNYTAIINKWE